MMRQPTRITGERWSTLLAAIPMAARAVAAAAGSERQSEGELDALFDLVEDTTGAEPGEQSVGGLAVFVVGLVLDAAAIKRIGAPIMGVAILLGLAVLAARLWRLEPSEATSPAVTEAV